MANPCIEFERALAQQKKIATTDPKKLEAIRALTDLVSAATRLSSVWEKLDDASFLDTGYPKGIPSFDEFVDELRDWRDKAKSASR